MIDDTELARRSIRGFGELIAALGRGCGGPEAEIRWPNALGARIEAAAENPWFNAVVVPLGKEPPADDPRLPKCVWTLARSVPGRVEVPEIALPCMGVALDDLALEFSGATLFPDTVPLEILGEINERAYNDTGWFSPLVQTLQDNRIGSYGLRNDGGDFVSVVLTLSIDDDLTMHYAATEESHRRRGLASSLVRTVMAKARQEGMRSATLQASSDGLPVWERLGFRHLATLRGYLRPNDKL